MTEIRLIHDNGYIIEASGHSDTAVCAAVSVIMFTTLNIIKLNNHDCTLECDDGYMKITAPEDAIDDKVYEFISIAFTSMAMNYPDIVQLSTKK